MKKFKWPFWREWNFDKEDQENLYKTLEAIVKEDLVCLGNYVCKHFKDNKNLVSNIVIWPKIDKELTINELKSELMHDKHLKLFLIVKNGDFIYHPQIRNTKKFPVAQYLGEPLAITNRQNVIFSVTTSLLSDKYLSLLFKSSFIESKLFFLASAGLQGGISWEELCSLQIKVPPLELQQKFINIYELLEKEINTRKSINEELENVMLSYFKYLQENHGSSIKKLGDLYWVIVGWQFPEDANFPKTIIEIPILNREQLITQDRKFISDISETIVPSNERNYKLPKVPANSIILVKMLLMNNHSLSQKIISHVAINQKTIYLNQELCGLYPRNDIGLYYSYFLIKGNIDSLSKKANVTRTRYHLTKQTIEDFEVNVVNKEQIDRFNEFCKPLFQLQNCNEEIIKELKNLKQYAIEYIASSK